MSIQIRLATPADAAGIAAIYASFCGGDSAISFETTPPPPAEMGERIARTTVSHPWLVAADATGIRGYVYASRHRERAAYRWAVEVTAYLRADSRGRGLGTALYGVLFDVLRAQGFHRAYAGIALPNPASIGLHTSLGFRRVGVYRGVGYKAGAWRDVSWWELALQPETVEPSEPQPLAAVLGGPVWARAIAAVGAGRWSEVGVPIPPCEAAGWRPRGIPVCPVRETSVPEISPDPIAGGEGAQSARVES